MTVALVGCVGMKLDRPAPARDLYVSPLFKKTRALVERARLRWWILSAAHGLVHPLQVIAPYDVTLANMTASERDEWGRSVFAAIARETFEGERLVLLAGERYATTWREMLNATRRIEEPMRGMGIGDRLGWLSRKDVRI